MRWFWQRRKPMGELPLIPAGAERWRLRYTGDVQAVGFRFTAQAWAKQRGLTGWVKNLSDGSVLLEVQGTPEQIDAFEGDVAAESVRKGAFIHAQLAEETPLNPIHETSFRIENLL